MGTFCSSVFDKHSLKGPIKREVLGAAAALIPVCISYLSPAACWIRRQHEARGEPTPLHKWVRSRGEKRPREEEDEEGEPESGPGSDDDDDDEDQADGGGGGRPPPMGLAGNGQFNDSIGANYINARIPTIWRLLTRWPPIHAPVATTTGKHRPSGTIPQQEEFRRGRSSRQTKTSPGLLVPSVTG